MKLLIIIITAITVYTATVIECSPRCECTDSQQQVIHIYPPHKGRGNCSLGMDELVKGNLVDLLSSCKNINKLYTQFILYKNRYVVNEHTLLTKTKIRFDKIEIRGEPEAIIDCSISKSLMISRVFGKANSTLIHDIEFRNCTGLLIESDLGKAVVELKQCIFTTACLKFNFTNKMKMVEIGINSTCIKNCNCSHGIVEISSTLAVRKNLHSNTYIRLNDVSVIDNYSPFIALSELQVLVMLRGDCKFENNKDFRIQIENNSKLIFSGATVKFDKNILNSTAHGTIIMVKQAIIAFQDSVVTFSKNEGSPSGGIKAVNSAQIVIKDNVIINFIENRGLFGGALFLSTQSELVFNSTLSQSVINFISNTAQFGGGIYVQDRTYSKVQSVFDVQGNSELMKVKFQNNSALLGGNQIYGGWIWFTEQSEDVVHILNFNNDTNDSSRIASDPVRVCLCSNDNSCECNNTNPTITVYGCTLDLKLVAVGQNFTPVVAYVESSIAKHGSASPRIHSLHNSCTNVQYKIQSEETSIIIDLHLEPYLTYARLPERFNDSVSRLLFAPLIIHLKLEDCALGYMKRVDSCECVCLPLITSIKLNCDTNGHVIRNNQQWVGVTYASSEHGSVIAYEHCPFDYCRADKNPLIMQLKDPDKLCAFDRSGILCGGCKPNFSRVLGSSRCKKCTNINLLIIIPCTLLAGLILIVVLILLDITVSVGTISGLIFYANIIRAQHVMFFGSETTFKLSVFIAWLNFDLGIETCLFDGLDSYVETWLQFCFPLYILIIAFAIIISSHYSMKISKLCGKNIVPVLATLFLLSYSKLLQLVVDVFTFARILHSDGYTNPVWLYDGNVDYLKGKHVPLFLVTILLQVLLIVYPISLVSIQWLVRISHYRAMSWVQRLKPFFDAYTGPFKPNHCYWTGLLLIVRIILLLTFTLHRCYSSIPSLLAITVVSIGLLAYLAATKGVYKNSLPNYLELFFLCNLGLTSTAVLFELANDSQGKQSGVPITISTGFTSFVFTGIIFFHTLRRLSQTTFGDKMKNTIVTLISLKRKVSRDTQSPPCSAPQVTCTLIELKEPLLEC